MKSEKIKAALLAPALLLSVSPLLACGPWFPNNMLDRGDAAVLVAPVANFYHELDRMKMDPPRFQAVLSTNSHSDETLQTELADLRAALIKSGKSANETERIALSHLAERAKLQKYLDAFQQWTDSAPTEWENDQPHRETPHTPAPVFPTVSIVDGLPGEFGDYFKGVISWNNPNETDKTSARLAWESLLNRPESERRYKSTWAAYMLGRSWEAEDPKKARDYFKQVRDLVAQGFSDPTGLATASMGLEARVALRANEFQTAIELYLEQYAASGWGSGESLQVAIGRAVQAGPKVLAPLALNPQTRRVVTAYLISQKGPVYDDAPALRIRKNIKAWLEAVEQADVKDMESAEQFALAAYQADEVELALRWVNRAGSSPTAQWLEAKLLLRAGRVGQATELLAQIVDSFPLDTSTNATAETPPSFADGLFVPDTSENESVPAGRYIRGELGALQLSRREYIQSLDLLLRGDFWADAAYVADHVLTTDELKSYVDDNWSAITPSDDENKTESEKHLEQLTSDIRYLLARRLTRESHGPEARAYYPAQWLPMFDQLMEALNTGWNESLPADQRAKALAAAAFIARTNGMELLGTEAGPDWHIYGGSFEEGVTADTRTNQDAIAVVASPDELKRDAESRTDPDKRFHYRYQAAALAWEAAKLLPNNSDETARLLCIAGSWLKAREPLAADLFYKALVNRCRKTALGAKADEIRWFPEIDEVGNLLKSRLETLDLPTAAEISSHEEFADYPIPGKYLLIMASDHVRDIVAAVQRLGVTITAKEIYAANPGLTPSEYTVGRQIFIPLPGSGDAIQSPANQRPSALDELQPIPISSGEAPVMQSSAEEYVVQSGDTLAKIAKQFGVSVEEIRDANLLNTFSLKVGQHLLIPTQ